jgi:hypothetical protein
MTESRPMGQVPEEILSAVRKSQAAVVDAIQTWAGAVQSITPPLPELNVPFADKLPRPQDLVAGAYDFAEQLLASQRTFAEDVLAATGSLLPVPQEDAPSAARTKKAGAAAK